MARPGRDADDRRPLGDDAFERRLIIARRRLETAARAAGGTLAEIAVPSASARTIVYKGLVIGGRLADLFPDLRAPLRLGYAVFHQRYATNTHPVWRLAQPFRSISHNGEINTVRGNREEVRGRAGDVATSALARELLAAGPLLSPDGSDSLSLDEALELLLVTGWELTPALLTAIPEALAVRRAPHPHVATLRRRTAGFLAPWDGPAAIVFADGRRVGALVDRNGLRPAAFSVTRDRMVAVASEAGAVPFDGGRDGPPRSAGTRPAAAGGAGPPCDPRGRRRQAPRPASAWRSTTLRERCTRIVSRRPSRPMASKPRMPCATWPGLDAERARLDIKTMALEGHEPLWSMGDDTPTPGRARLDRPVADHLRQAFAQVTNPAIDPERERVVMDLRVELGRRPPLLGGMPRAPRTARLQRPIVADLDGLLDELRAAGSVGPTPRRDLGCEATGRPGSPPRSTDSPAMPSRARGAGRRSCVITDRAWSMDRPPIPSILATGAVHTALTTAGLRGRTDIAVSAVDILDVHAMAMLLAVGATAVQPRLAIELAAELAGTRGAEEKAPVDTVGSLLDAFEAGLRKTLARMGISAVSSYIGGALIDVIDLDAFGRRPLLPDGGRMARPDDPRRPGCQAPPSPRGRPGHAGAAGRPRAAAPGPGLRPVPRRR